MRSLALIGAFWASLSLASIGHAVERAAMVMDANTGQVLYSSDGDAPRYPASLTKMMTLYMAFELIEKGRLSYSDRITVSAQASAAPPSKLGLDAGDTISVRDAVRALVTKSANDVAVAVAEHIGGSEANFARLMTRKAREIGMNKTTFRNASGLPNDEQLTTARDILTLALRLQDEFPSHYGVFSTRSFSYAGSTYRSHNTLLYHYKGTDGIKTGYTRASGFNLVSSVRRDGRHLVAAVFGGATAGSRNAQMRAILDRAFAKASTRRTRPKPPVLIAAPSAAKRPPSVASATVSKPRPAAPPRAVAAASTERDGKAKEELVKAVLAVAAVKSAAAETETADTTETPRAALSDETDVTARVSVARVRPVMFGDAASPPRELATQSDGAILPNPTASAPLALRPAETPPASPGAAPGEHRGRPPSTLHEQLARILADNRPETAGPQQAGVEPMPRVAAATPPPPPTYNLRGPVRDTVSRARGPYLIQVGAFNTEAEAQRRLDLVRGQAVEMLGSASSVTEAVARGEKQFYRARFAGFDQAAAAEICTELRRRSIDCLVAKSN